MPIIAESSQINNKDYTVFHLNGHWNSSKDSKKLRRAMHEELSQGNKYFILHFHSNLFSDPAFPGLLLRIIILIQSAKGTLQIIAENKEIYEHLKSIRIQSLVPVYCSK
jgi:hypothetical protein